MSFTAILCHPLLRSFPKRALLARCFSTTQKDTAQFFVALAALRKEDIELKQVPTFVVVGPQSSGKSSAIDAIIGHNLLPKASSMATRKPTEITLLRQSERDQRTLFHVGDREFIHDFEAQEEIKRLNENSSVDSIQIVVESPDVYNTKFVDLPGLFSVMDEHNPELKKVVKKMTMDHIQAENSLVCVVSSAASDPATNPVIDLIKRFNKTEKTIGVLTQVDRVEGTHVSQLLKMVKEKRYAVGHGYIPVALRSEDDLKAGMTITNMILREETLLRSKGVEGGVLNLRKTLSNIQFDSIKHKIPEILGEIRVKLTQLEKSGHFLETVIADPKLASRLATIIEKLVGSSIERADFEYNLREEFIDKLVKLLEEKIPVKLDPNPNFVAVGSNINSYIWGYNSSRHSNPERVKSDEFRDLFGFGSVSPLPITDESLSKALDEESQLGCYLPTIKYVVDDPVGRKRAAWHRTLQSFFEHLLSNAFYEEAIVEITQRHLLNYINEQKGESPLAARFAEFLIGEISNSALEKNIKTSIRSLVNMQKRPLVSSFELARNFAQLYPKHFTYAGGIADMWNKDSRPLLIEVFGDAWNYAYIRSVANQLANDSYRNIAVNLLDKLVVKVLEMTIDLFNKENVHKEKQKVDARIQSLKKIESVVQSYL